MKKTLLVLLFLFGNQRVFASNLGVHGETYEIREPSVLSQIQDKLKDAEKSGKLAKINEEFVKKSKAHINRPVVAANFSKAENDREWIYDPTISLDHDLKDQLGRVFYRAGTKVNPLDQISLLNVLIFIDGDDSKQVDWALKQYRENNKKAKLILVKGAVIDLMKAKKVRFYFNQNAILTSKFNIQHVPAIVQQEGKILKVREVAI